LAHPHRAARLHDGGGDGHPDAREIAADLCHRDRAVRALPVQLLRPGVRLRGRLACLPDPVGRCRRGLLGPTLLIEEGDHMKRFLSAGLALVLVGGAVACVDLGEKLVSSLGSDYAKSQQGLTDLTNGIYAGVRSYNGGDTYYGMEILGTDTWTAADQVAAGGAQPWIYLDTYDAQYNSLSAFLNPQWQAGYTIIARANVVLDNGPSTPIGGVLTQAIKDSRLGEAHFLRAWAYFQLVQQYGDLTINLHSGQLSTEAVREPEDSVYKVIIDDLNQAITLLPVTQSEFGRVTLGAAQHLLAKAYLTRAYRDWNTPNMQADFQQALTLANTVINSGMYSLVPIYADLWCGTHRAAAPLDPGRQGFCDVTNGFSEKNSEVIW